MVRGKVFKWFDWDLMMICDRQDGMKSSYASASGEKIVGIEAGACELPYDKSMNNVCQRLAGPMERQLVQHSDVVAKREVEL